MVRYEEISHTADLACRVYGKDLPELFSNAAYAMFDMMAEISDMVVDESVEIEIEAEGAENLLVAWLNEILYISFIRKMLFREFFIKELDGSSLVASAKGGLIGIDPSRVKKEIKAATYHDVEIKKTDSGYEVVVVFDV